jgi:hypothetical protein
LNHLAVLPYFCRVWIIQEARVATSCTLLWGACWISLSDFVSLIPWLLSFCFTQYDVHVLLDVNAILRVYHLESQKRDTLQSLLRVSSMHDATDERDKVFAILSLVEGRQPFQADYRKTLAEVHYDALNTLFKDRSDFEFLT